MRTHRIAKRAALIAGSAITLAAAPAAAHPPVATVSCGQTLAHSVRLANDLRDCPREGLIIGADRITIDLNGHTIDGTATQAADCDTVDFDQTAGIDDRAGHDGLTIENGTVQQFPTGIGAGSDTTGMADSHLRHLVVRDNRFSGIDIGSAQRLNNNNEIDDNVATGNGCGFGIALNNTHANRVAGNRTVHNSWGILVCCGDHNVVEDNVVSRSRHDQVIVCCGPDADNVIRYNTVLDGDEGGIDLCCGEDGQHNLVANNSISGNLGDGILSEGAGDNAIVANHVFSNGDGIGGDGNRNKITHNDVTDAVGCPDGCGYGISLEGGDGNLIAGNTVARTLLDGIRIASFEPFGTAPNTNTIARDNSVRDAKRDGIAVATEGGGPVSGALLDANSVSHSGHDGINVATPSATLTDNLAIRNLNLGIEAVPGVTDGGGNRAFGNGNPLQCTNVSCAGH
jgi:parallel beta-helix repeat protein